MGKKVIATNDSKLCTKCLKWLPFSDFYRQKGSKLGCKSACKKCEMLILYAWRKRNPETCRAIDKKHRIKYRERRLAYCHAYYRKNLERSRQIGRETIWKLKDEAYEKYGGYRCVCCGETERAFLSLDHIDNNGHAHRKKIRTIIYRWAKMNNYPPILQVLCMNCQFGKRTYGVCPHQLPNAQYAPLVIREL